MKRLPILIVIILLLAVASAASLWHQHQRFLETPLEIAENGLVLDVKAGAGIRSVISILEQQSDLDAARSKHLTELKQAIAELDRTGPAFSRLITEHLNRGIAKAPGDAAHGRHRS